MSGIRLQEQGNATQARAQYEQVLALDEHHPDALHLLALLDLAAGDPQSALDKITLAITSYPRHAVFHVTHARILLVLARRSDAIAALEYAASGRVEQPQSWTVRDDVVIPSQEPAAPSAAQADAAISDEEIKAQLGRASELRREGKPVEAEQVLRKLLDLRPHHRDALIALASVLREMLRHADAVEVYQLLLAVGDNSATIASMADSLVQIGETDEARRLCEQALELSPNSLRLALPTKLSLRPVYGDVADLQNCRERYASGLGQLREGSTRFLVAAAGEVRDSLVWSNFYLAYQGGNDLPLQAEYADFAAGLLDKVLPQLREPIQQPTISDRRIRIGFASHYFYECSAGRYFRNWITGLDRDKFEIFVYHVRPGMDALSRSISESVDHFRGPDGGKFFGETIRGDELDVLVYPELGGNGLTFLLAALRLAPVQCAGWGHPVTTGHETIDYFFSSDLMEPHDAQSHYREQLVRLPGIGIDYAPPRWDEPRSMSEARERLGLPLDRRLYLFPQSVYKIHPANDALMADVLVNDSRGVVVLFPGHTAETTEQFLRRLSAVLKTRGLDINERVLILPIMSRQTYMQVNAACDVMLDSLHWSGGNTSLDALAAGLPIVTLPGQFMRGRQTCGMLKALGIPALTASDERDYVELALTIATNRERRADLAQQILIKRAKLFNDRRAIAAMESFYVRLLT